MKHPAVWVQALLPQRLLGLAVYHLSRCTWDGVKTPLIRWFAGQYSVDLAEAERDRLDSYESFNDFFTRRLKAGARPVAGDAATLISPVDGRLTRFGTASGGEMIQAKGLTYRVHELLGEPPEHIDGLTNGSYATLYLAPHQYHRVHLPLDGTLVRTRYIPGKRYSVNDRPAAAMPRLFCRNERVVCWFETRAGPMAVVLVGALNVSSITSGWLGEIRSGREREWRDAGTPRQTFARGEEIGRFNLGSTVILLLPGERLTWHPALAPGHPMRMGEALARVSRQSPAEDGGSGR